MPQRESMVKAGDYARVSIFPVRRSSRGRRKSKAMPTSEVQCALNEKNRQHHFEDLVHANFTEKDLYLTLTYRDDNMPQTPDEAKRAIQNAFRRIKARCIKLGLDAPKYLYVTERGSRTGRIHHHVFLSCGLSRDEIETIWGNGYANSRRLEFDSNGLAGLVKYSLKTGVHRPDEEDEKVGYRTYSGSRNLKKPIKRQNDYRIRAKDAAYIDAHPDDLNYISHLYPDYVITRVEPTSCSEIETDKSPIPKAHFITIWMYRADTKLFGSRKRTKPKG